MLIFAGLVPLCWPGAPAAVTPAVRQSSRWEMLISGLVPLCWPGAPAALTPAVRLVPLCWPGAPAALTPGGARGLADTLPLPPCAGLQREQQFWRDPPQASARGPRIDRVHTFGGIVFCSGLMKYQHLLFC